MNVIILSAILGVILMFLGIWVKKVVALHWLSILAAVLLFACSVYDVIHAQQSSVFAWNNMLEINEYNTWFNVILTFCFMLYIFLFHTHIYKVGKHGTDYTALLFFTMCGIYLLTLYNNLLILFIGIEILSIPQYILACSDKENLKSNEAALKYFLMGAFSTGILLMGITLIYGATGTFDISTERFIYAFSDAQIVSPLLVIGVLLLLIAFGFKSSAAPMHFWTPDVYDGTPTAFTPFMASIAKVGVFFSFIKLFHFGFGTIQVHYQYMLAAIIILTLLIGNITAVYQQSVKRMLAYSSIAQAGFMLFAVFAINAAAWQGLMLYAVAYTLATLGIFAVLIKLKDYTFSGFSGLAKSQPILALTATVCLLSLAGIPLTAGFFAKYFILTSVMQQGIFIWLLIIALIMTAISVYYYFKVIRSMYFNNDTATTSYIVVEPYEKCLLLINMALIILIGIIPSFVIL